MANTFKPNWRFFESQKQIELLIPSIAELAISKKPKKLAKKTLNRLKKEKLII